MTHKHHDDFPLAASTFGRCHVCGQPMPAPLLHGAADDGLCSACWLRSWWRFEDDQRQRVLEALAQRVRIGRRLGNDRRVMYPADLDLHLISRLETMRRFLVRVEITVASDRFDEEHRVVEGHLRRFGSPDDERSDFHFDLNLLGLFLNAIDREPLAALDEEEFERIVRIELIDDLLLGNQPPVVVWEASPEQTARHAARRKDSLARERRRAAWFLIHAALVLVVWTGLLAPVVVALTSGAWWRALLSGIAFAVVGFLAAMSLAIWEPQPDLMVVFCRRHKAGDAGTDAAVNVLGASH